MIHAGRENGYPARYICDLNFFSYIFRRKMRPVKRIMFNQPKKILQALQSS